MSDNNNTLCNRSIKKMGCQTGRELKKVEIDDIVDDGTQRLTYSVQRRCRESTLYSGLDTFPCL